MADVMETADVRVIQQRNRSRLAVQAFVLSGLARKMGGNYLDGDDSVQTGIRAL
jgi:hypothetical protein